MNAQNRRFSADPATDAPAVQPRALIADDFPAARHLLRKLLGDDWSITCVCDGVEAVEACADDSFDLILMDVRMPRMSGVEATKAIRERHRGGAAPKIVAVTAISAYLAPADAGVFDAVLDKPLSAMRFTELVRDVMAGRRSANAAVVAAAARAAA